MYDQLEIDQAITVLTSRRDENANMAAMLDIAVSALRGTYVAKLKELDTAIVERDQLRTTLTETQDALTIANDALNK